MLRKIFPASMLFVLIILTLASCSGSTPVPAAEEVTVQPERPQAPSSPVMAKLSRAAELLAAKKKDESGYAVLKSDLTADGITVKEGSYYRENSDGTSETSLTVEYIEDGKTVRISDTSSLKVTYDDSPLTEELKREAKTALDTVKGIPAYYFEKKSDGTYVYDVIQSQHSSFARQLLKKNISYAAVSFEISSNKIVRTVDAAYSRAGSVHSVKEVLTRELESASYDFSHEFSAEYTLERTQNMADESIRRLEAKDALINLISLDSQPAFDPSSWTSAAAVTGKNGSVLIKYSQVTDRDSLRTKTVKIETLSPVFANPFVSQGDTVVTTVSEIAGGSREVTRITSGSAVDKFIITEELVDDYADKSGSLVIRNGRSETLLLADVEEVTTYPAGAIEKTVKTYTVRTVAESLGLKNIKDGTVFKVVTNRSEESENTAFYLDNKELTLPEVLEKVFGISRAALADAFNGDFGFSVQEDRNYDSYSFPLYVSDQTEKKVDVSSLAERFSLELQAKGLDEFARLFTQTDGKPTGAKLMQVSEYVFSTPYYEAVKMSVQTDTAAREYKLTVHDSSLRGEYRFTEAELYTD